MENENTNIEEMPLSETEGDSLETVSEPMALSDAVVQSLADALTKIETYVPTVWVDNTEPDIDAEHLNHAEQAIMRVTALMNGAVDVIQDLQSQVTSLNSNFETVNGSILIATNSIDAVKSTFLTVCQLSLEAGHTYLLLGNIGSSKGDVSSILLATITRADGTAGKTMLDRSTRTTMSNGGGATIFGFCECITDCTVSLKSYGYSDVAEYQFIGTLMALQLK